MMVRYIYNFLLPVFLLFLVACNETNTATDTITGKLKIFLHQQDPVGLYVRFELLEITGTSRHVTITSSGFNKIVEHPVNFALTYSPEEIDQQKRYKVFVTVSQDLQGRNEIVSMSSFVLTLGYPTVLNLAMQPMVEPIE